MPNVNLDQVLSAARWIISTGSGYLVGKGVITADQVELLTGAVTAVIPLVWSFFVHKTPAA